MCVLNVLFMYVFCKLNSQFHNWGHGEVCCFFQYDAGNTSIANLLFYWLYQPVYVEQQIINQSHFHLIWVHELQVNVLDSERWYNHNNDHRSR